MDLNSNFFVFLLATFLGLEVVRRVSPLLHTPPDVADECDFCHFRRRAILIAGQYYPADQPYGTLAKVLGVIAVALAFSTPSADT